MNTWSQLHVVGFLLQESNFALASVSMDTNHRFRGLGPLVGLACLKAENLQKPPLTLGTTHLEC